MRSMGLRIRSRLSRHFSRRLRAITRATRRVALFEGVEPRRLMAAVSGSVYNDASHYGFRDPNELGLGGQTVYADANFNNQLDAGERSTVSAANGSYTLDNLPVSPFSLRVKPSGDYTQTKPQQNLGYYVGVQNGALAPTGTEFGVFTGVVIRGQVFNDANGNGVRDNGESPSASAVVFADYKDANVGNDFAQNDVQADGSYVIYAQRRNFTLTLVPFDGQSATTPSTVPVTINNGSPSLTTTNFGIRPTASSTNTTVIGTVFVDKNHNGVRDAGEPGVTGGSVGLSDGQSGRGFAQIAPDGTFTIGNATGTGQVQLYVQVNGKLVQSNPAYGTTRTLTLKPGTVVNAGDIAFDERAAYLNVSSFDDKNKNGQQDAGEGSVFSFFWLDTNGDNVRQDDELATNGQFVLPSGTYRVAVQFENDTDQIADAFKTITIDTSTGADFNLTFGRGSTVVTPPPTTNANVSGTVYNDANGNGKRDAGEAGLSGVAVYADYNYNGVLDAGETTATTDANGTYAFTAAIRPFALRTALASGQTQTAPANNGVYYYEARNGALVGYGSDFGVKSTATTVTGTINIGPSFEDSDKDGVRDRGELPLGNLDLWIDTDKDGVHDSNEQSILYYATAHGQGPYDDTTSGTVTLPLGTYRIAVKGSYADGSAGVSAFRDVTLNSANQTVAISFPFAAVRPRFEGRVYLDENRNSFRDPSETKTVPGTVWADYDSDNVIDANEPTAPEITSDGYYSIVTDRRTFVLRFKPADGYTQTWPPEGQLQTINAAKTTFLSGLEFGAAPLPTTNKTTIVAHVYTDANKNGTIDGNETSLGSQGQTVYADYNYNGVLDAGEASAITDATGTATLMVDNRAFALRLKPFGTDVQTAPANNGVYYYEVRGGVPTGYGSTFGVVATGTPVQTGTLIVNPYVAGVEAIAPGFATDPTTYFRYFGGYTFWIDANGNNVRDGSEQALASRYYDPDSAFEIRESLPYGTYKIAVGKYNAAGGETALQSQTVTLNNPFASVNFTVQPVGPIVWGYVYYDANDNGQRDAGEQTLDGLNNIHGEGTVFADYDQDGVRDADEPLANLYYEGLLASFPEYNGFFVLHPEAGRTFKLGATGFSTQLNINLLRTSATPTYTLGANDAPVTAQVGFDYAKITGIAYDDANKNGQRDAGEAGLPDVTVWADYNSNGLIDSGENAFFTAADGSYVAVVDPTKPFTLRAKAPNGRYVREGYMGYAYTSQNGRPVGTGSTFGLERADTAGTGQILVNYFADYNGNGIRDDGDGGYAPAAGRGAFIDKNRNDVFDAGDQRLSFLDYTGGGGYYYFGELTNGTYHIVLNDGLAAGESVVGGNTRDITIDDQHQITTLEIPVAGYKYAVLVPNVFFDTNKDGYQQAGERSAYAEQDGLTIYVDLNYNGVRDSNEPATSPLNHYGNGPSFTLLPGSYSIRVAKADGSSATFAYGATSRWVTLSKPGVYTTQLGIVS